MNVDLWILSSWIIKLFFFTYQYLKSIRFRLIGFGFNYLYHFHHLSQVRSCLVHSYKSDENQKSDFCEEFIAN